MYYSNIYKLILRLYILLASAFSICVKLELHNDSNSGLLTMSTVALSQPPNRFPNGLISS